MSSLVPTPTEALKDLLAEKGRLELEREVIKSQPAPKGNPEAQGARNKQLERIRGLLRQNQIKIDRMRQKIQKHSNMNQNDNDTAVVPVPRPRLTQQSNPTTAMQPHSNNNNNFDNSAAGFVLQSAMDPELLRNLPPGVQYNPVFNFAPTNNYKVGGHATVVTGDNNKMGAQGMEEMLQRLVERFAQEQRRLLGADKASTADSTTSQEQQRETERVIRSFLERDGTNKDGTNKDGTNNLQRHKELLERLGELLDAVKEQPEFIAKQFTQEDGPLPKAVETAVKKSLPRFQRQDDSGFFCTDPNAGAVNLADHFDEETSVKTPQAKGKQASVSSPQEDNATKLQRVLKVSKPKDIAAALCNDIQNDDGAFLASGLTDLLENTLLAVQDVQDRSVAMPEVYRHGLAALCESRPNETVWNAIGSTLVLHNGCFVCVSENDSGEALEDAAEITGQTLQHQRTPCMVCQSVEVTYSDEDGDEAIAVIEFTSAFVTESKDAILYVLEQISLMESVTKCQINGTYDRFSMVDTAILKDLVSKGILLHFHKCDLTYHQVLSFAGMDCALILDNSSINGLENALLSDANSRLSLAFKGVCPKFGTLVEHINAGKLKALMFKDIDLLDIYKQEDGDASPRDAADRALGELETLIQAARRFKCDLVVSDVVTLQESCKPHCPDVWNNEIGIDAIARLGGTGATTRSVTEAAVTDASTGEADAAKGNDSSGTTATPSWKVISQEKNGKLIELSSTGRRLRFTKYGRQKLTFELEVGETQSLDSESGTVVVLDSGLLQYNVGEKAAILAKVPAMATEAKW
eukprot:CAMPEP_0117010648 /NCGR_PEP_ID=MMETSP0472-20121206/9335_1 /TAXON_ID=693140 ORGANISM="Tiarina fusus, Strain LIS" /NCGR_SAMPLE_ID=MMETSP0472 /ASSEMBLY_ACC=CAM_ASM_000603 /LENGTH=806 /DNA_ID=CAMNT_0004713241 /DNA_START=78 /DNA_END=2495 /DNA_ORIENTATION=-